MTQTSSCGFLDCDWPKVFRCWKCFGVSGNTLFAHVIWSLEFIIWCAHWSYCVCFNAFFYHNVFRYLAAFNCYCWSHGTQSRLCGWENRNSYRKTIEKERWREFLSSATVSEWNGYDLISRYLALSFVNLEALVNRERVELWYTSMIWSTCLFYQSISQLIDQYTSMVPLSLCLETTTAECFDDVL